VKTSKDPGYFQRKQFEKLLLDFSRMIGTLDIKLEDYGVSFQKGFLPSEEPLKVLPSSYYQPWETIIQEIPKLIRTFELRQEVDRLPVLSTEYLETEREWQRAYVILCFMTHGYIWGGERPSEVSSNRASIKI